MWTYYFIVACMIGFFIQNPTELKSRAWPEFLLFLRTSIFFQAPSDCWQDPVPRVTDRPSVGGCWCLHSLPCGLLHLQSLQHWSSSTCASDHFLYLWLTALRFMYLMDLNLGFSSFVITRLGTVTFAKSLHSSAQIFVCWSNWDKGVCTRAEHFWAL